MKTRNIARRLLTVAAACLPLSCGGGSPTGTVYDPEIDPADFVAGIQNPYLMFTPGTTFVYSDGGSERIEVTITNDTKTILGVACLVVHDQAFEDDELIEDTYDWYAEDVDGNVWYFGEATEELDGGTVVSTEGSWEAGVDGAKPGILMQGAPAVGQSYRQEYYEGEAEDMAEVVSLSASVAIDYGSYSNCLKTKEWTPLEPGVAEHKYYALGVGLVLEESAQGGSGRVELVEVVPAR